MPTLPSITINDQTKFDRIVAAFGNAETYRAWLKQQIIDQVARVESQKILDQRDAEADAKYKEAQSTLGAI